MCSETRSSCGRAFFRTSDGRTPAAGRRGRRWCGSVPDGGCAPSPFRFTTDETLRRGTFCDPGEEDRRTDSAHRRAAPRSRASSGRSRGSADCPRAAWLRSFRCMAAAAESATSRLVMPARLARSGSIFSFTSGLSANQSFCTTCTPESGAEDIFDGSGQAAKILVVRRFLLRIDVRLSGDPHFHRKLDRIRLQLMNGQYAPGISLLTADCSGPMSPGVASLSRNRIRICA